MTTRERLEMLLARWLERQRAGDRPIDAEELCRDAPELLEPLRRRIRELETAAPGDAAFDSADAAGWLAALRGRRDGAPDVSEEAPTPLHPGRLLARRYRIRALLGLGGQGEVWRAEDLKLRVDVALKAVRADRAAGRRTLERLRREVLAARDVVSPNVCRIFDLVDADGHELVSMEYVDGETLAQRLERNAPLPLEEAMGIASQLLAGLEAIHAAGLVHRDLKPENVMLTRSGRVVVMDLGLAKSLTGSSDGSISGTPAYMAPEQAAGQAVDARADVYSAAVLLAELVHPDGIAGPDARRRFWEGVRRTPPRLGDTPWTSVLQKALAPDRSQRPACARELARALERVAVGGRVGEAAPYPGLAPFDERHAEYFFGREAEIEALWRRLDGPARLLAVVGPSGAGKSSFLRAGVVAARPEGWGVLVATPGSTPLVSLGQALAKSFGSEPGVAASLVRFGELPIAVELIRRWRERSSAALLIVDQLEELFTQCPEETQQRFAELLGRLPLEADVHVLLGMRDDFLLACQRFEPLAPIFTELTPLQAPTGAALRRALVQPASKCGYRFEDDRLVDEMIAEVEGERGALPLLAFAAATLWERRDRERGLLTHAAHREIGGVAGALAAHAEATLERIGAAHRPLVRDLFRNLVTVQGTRASRPVAELVSAAEDRDAARKVVAILVDARLLTEYEMRGRTSDDSPEQRVEVVHESLLTAWPRLVRWRTQDADAAQLRDQLRQAAQLWQEKRRPEELLWTGTSYREYELWRERYPGRLSEVEQAFGKAMSELAQRRRRRRRRFAAATAAALAATALTLGLFWRDSEQARAAAVQQAHRAEASKLLALGRLELERHPTAALAYTLASLELADDPTARRFAVEALFEGPTAFALEGEAAASHLAFSPDGEWLAVGGLEDLALRARDGGSRRVLEGWQGGRLAFSPSSDRLAAADPEGIHVWSIPGGELVRTIETARRGLCWFVGDGARIAAAFPEDAAPGPAGRPVPGQVGHWLVQSWPEEGGPPTTHGHFRTTAPLQVQASGALIVVADGTSIRLHDLGSLGKPGRLVGVHEAKIGNLALDPTGRRVAARDVGGALRIWKLSAPEPTLETEKRWPAGGPRLRFDPSGATLAAAGQDGRILIWRLDGAPDAAPLALRRGPVLQATEAVFDPRGEWLATANLRQVDFWPLPGPYPEVLGEPGSQKTSGLALAPDGSWLAASVFGSLTPIRLFALRTSSTEWPRTLGASAIRLAAHPDGERLLGGGGSGVSLLSARTGASRPLAGFSSAVWAVAFSLDGRLAAAGGGNTPAEGVVRVWELESGGSRLLDPGDRRWISALHFLPDGRLVAASGSGVRRWDLATGTMERLSETDVEYLVFALTRDGRQMVSAGFDFDTMSTEVLRWVNLETGDSRPLPAFAATIVADFDPSGGALVTGDIAGVIHVGAVDGGEPHLLYGHENAVWDVETTPDGRRIASVGDDGTVRIWPMPDVARTPLHALPYDELLAKLRSLTNLRVVADPASPTGYSLRSEPFRSWGDPPSW